MTGSPEHADGPAPQAPSQGTPQAVPPAIPQAPTQARIRSAGPTDAAALMRLKQQLDEETSFMLFEPGERDPSVPKLAAHLEKVAGSGNSMVLLAETGGELTGYLELIGGKARRNRSTTHVVIGVLARASGRGVGSGLLREAVRWSAEQGLHRVELTVMAHNARAVALYERMGFVVEGRARECLHIDGQFVDELQMAMLLPGPQG
ncbi:MAG TPA: GNAT family N-acetyltransferase [Streptosporangiaceae bacterium]